MKRVQVVEEIMSANDRVAADNRVRLEAAGVRSMNLLASPGAGKTTLIEHTVAALKGTISFAMVNGDIATSLDADRAAAAGARAVQVNTGGACHLDASMLGTALGRLDLGACDLLLVENVGNLICPANFALGTHRTVLVASVPEGDDKPYKYPASYRGVDVVVVNKIDLLPYVDFDMARFRRGVEMLNPGVAVFPLSCRTGEGLSDWLAWVRGLAAESARDRG
jgi:hydrogenase nickel incorporation protein HypB